MNTHGTKHVQTCQSTAIPFVSLSPPRWAEKACRETLTAGAVDMRSPSWDPLFNVSHVRNMQNIEHNICITETRETPSSHLGYEN